ncbi:hypothetical protein BGZ80_006143 [Entomortierella chlamydospora]|uniref:Uncharacterized protein n=1 Tax=Entomortierella chlamydospora TaxID=101097 RepID=A0A9P6MIF7_9FUNG|nr:hypothetical protein BGZ80_006143 [Entomortierella chlamydospora]
MADVIAGSAGKEAAKAVAAGGISAMAQGAGKGLIEAGKKDPEPKKTKLRVVTVNQENMVKQVHAACKKFKEEIPLQAIYDAYGTLTLYWDKYLKAGLPWVDANIAVEAQVKEFEKKKLFQEGQDGLWKRVDDQTKAVISLIELKQPVPATVQKIADMYTANQPAGLRCIQGKIDEHALLLEVQLHALQELMRDEVEMKEF